MFLAKFQSSHGLPGLKASLLVVTPVKSKGSLHISNVMAQKRHYHFRRKDGWGMIRKYWPDTRLKPGKANAESSSSKSSVWGFHFKGVRLLCPSSSAACDICLFLGLVLLPVYSFTWQVSISWLCNHHHLGSLHC